MPTYKNKPIVSTIDDTHEPAVKGFSTKDGVGVYGESVHGDGVNGISHDNQHSGVVGINDWRPKKKLPFEAGAKGGGAGATALVEAARGGWFESSYGEGVRGVAHNPNHGGVVGTNDSGGTGIYGTSDSGVGVWGVSVNNVGAEGTSDNGVGVWGASINHEGVHAETRSRATAAIAAFQMNPESDSAALYAKHEGNRTAAFFEGNVVLSGHITFTGAADFAEDFDISAESCAEPGTVMALDDEGNLQESSRPYDKRVAGVVSGAGNYKPGLILDQQQSQSDRKPIALMGKVFCKVDAQFGPIGVGDLLTTSPTPGHAMRADDPLKAFGAVIGKALRPLTDGQGLIPILIALQ